MRLTISAIFLSTLLAGCSQEEPEPAPDAGESAAPVTETVPSMPAPAAAAADFPRQAYWGDTHVHTGWSADAGMDGAITTPDDAYRFALGETVESNTGIEAKLKRPFDWFLVSDHSDGMGVINEIVAGNEEMMADETLVRWREALTRSAQPPRKAN